LVDKYIMYEFLLDTNILYHLNGWDSDENAVNKCPAFMWDVNIQSWDESCNLDLKNPK